MQLSAQLRTSPPPSPRTLPWLCSSSANDHKVSLPHAGASSKRKQPIIFLLPLWLGVAVLSIMLSVSARGQSSITLAWDPDADNAVVGYRLYEGVVSQTYTNRIDAGTTTTVTVSNLVWGATYYFAVTAYDTNGQESALSDEISFTVPFPSDTTLTFTADSGTFTDPFTDNNGTLSQSVTTGVIDGGRAVYNFNITNAGNYLVTAEVIAPSLSENTFYVNIDAEPTDPLMIWDIPVCATSTSQTVSWRGNGSGDPASDQYSPKVFTLSVGPHQLIILGQDANATLGTITIVPLPPPPTLSISLTSAVNESPGGAAQPVSATAVLRVTGAAGQTCSVLYSDDLQTWTVLATVTLDESGSAQLSDPDGIGHPARMYRLQTEILIVAPPPALRLSISVASAGTDGDTTQLVPAKTVLSVTGAPGQTCSVLYSDDLQTWTVLGTVTLDKKGSAQLSDPDGVSHPARMYRGRTSRRSSSTRNAGDKDFSDGREAIGICICRAVRPASANGGYTFGGWTGSGSGSYSGLNNSAPVTMNGPITEAVAFTPAGGETAYVTGVVPGALHNDWSGWVGKQIGVGANPVTVTKLGRMIAPGNAGTHTVKLVRASDEMDVPGGSVSIAMSEGTAGQFQYGSLGSLTRTGSTTALAVNFTVVGTTARADAT
jgi:chitodextrinase